MKIANLLHAIPSIVSLAENIFSGKPKSGTDKKALVMTIAKTAVDTITDLSTGGQQHTWERLSGPISNIIDNIASVLFPSEKK